MRIRSGIGFDTHRFKEGRRLVLGGVEFEGSAGLEGHSDADVLCHAVADALLGAAADGDIGEHFPDTADEWKDADSLDLLKQVAERLRNRGMSVVNVDSTVIAEQPHLAVHRDAMRRNIAEAMGVEVSRVSVKATRPEKMGSLGREEGIAVLAVAAVMEGSEGSE